MRLGFDTDWYLESGEAGSEWRAIGEHRRARTKSRLAQLAGEACSFRPQPRVDEWSANHSADVCLPG